MERLERLRRGLHHHDRNPGTLSKKTGKIEGRIWEYQMSDFFRLASATAMLPTAPETSTRRSRADYCKEFDRYAGNGLMDKETMD